MGIPNFVKDSKNRNAIKDAQDAADQEHRMSVLRAFRLYPKAVGWSILLSTAVIMEGYDLLLMGSLYAQPAFQKKYGRELANGSFQIPAPWQAGLSNGASVGSIIGLIINGYISEQIGFRKTMMAALSLIVGIIFIPFFAPSLEVLLVGQILIGIPWGVFQTLTTAYAAEVTPTHLRAYLTTYVNFCWVFGQLTGAGILRIMLTRHDQWAYRIPFALQWIWPVPLVIGIYYAPDSPWWLVRQNRLDDAKAALLRLTSVNEVSEFDVHKTVSLMAFIVAQEKNFGTGTRYRDLFKGVDLRRTYVTCACWMIQILSGSGLRVYSTYFYEQAGLRTNQAFNMSIAGYALGIFGVICAWTLLPKVGRRTMYLWGLVCLIVCLMVVGILGVGKQPPASSVAWGIGSILLVHTFIYDISIGPICYSLVSELPSVRLRSKTVVLARASYNALNIVSNVITPYMLNPSAWNWGAKAGFFYAGSCLLSLIFTYFCIPEPKDRTFAELNVLFQKETSARKFAGTKVDLYHAQIDDGGAEEKDV